MGETGNFFNELGGTLTDAVDWVGDSLQNATSQAQAAIKINNAQAAAITESAKRKTMVSQNVMKIIVLTIICVTVVAVLSIGLKKR